MQASFHPRCTSHLQARVRYQRKLLQSVTCQAIPGHSRENHIYSHQDQNDNQALLWSFLKTTAAASKQCVATVTLSAALYISSGATWAPYSNAAEPPQPSPYLSQTPAADGPSVQTSLTAQGVLTHIPQPPPVFQTADSSSDTPAYCRSEVISQSIARFKDTPNEAESMSAVLNYYKKLGCTADEINAGFAQAYGEDPTGYMKGSEAPRMLGSPTVLLLQLAIAALSAFALLCWQDQPVGWVAKELVEVKTSSVAGKGLFAKSYIAKGTAIGAYPGRRRTPADMQQKAAAAPLAAQYAFLTSDNHYLDPTDMTGLPSAWPSPGMPWPLTIDTHLAYANEPPRGAGGTNCFVEDGQTTSELLFVTNRDIQPGEEIFIDYGITYDRSGYRS